MIFILLLLLTTTDSPLILFIEKYRHGFHKTIGRGGADDRDFPQNREQ